jgi:large subunit ribosomal protein L15
MPIYMRLGKQRGPTSRDAMPIGPFRTETVPVNVRDLDRFDDGDEVTPESLVAKGILKNTKIDVKLLATGEVTKALTVRVHRASAAARAKIEAAGGTVEVLRESRAAKRKQEPAQPEAESEAGTSEESES